MPNVNAPILSEGMCSCLQGNRTLLNPLCKMQRLLPKAEAVVFNSSILSGSFQRKQYVTVLISVSINDSQNKGLNTKLYGTFKMFRSDQVRAQIDYTK